MGSHHGTEFSTSEPKQVLAHDYTTREVNKGKSIIESPLLSNDGKHWLVRALDPFHDSLVKPGGYPDMFKGGTVIQELNLSMTVAAPAGLATGANWDCHVLNMCDIAKLSSSASQLQGFFNLISGSFTTAPGAVVLPQAGLVAFCGTAGAQFFVDDPNLVPTASGLLAYPTLDPSTYLTGQCRVVGGGFEVINTTATIYKQGLVTAYRMPQSKSKQTLSLSVKDSINNSVTVPMVVDQFIMPPSTQAEAYALPSSKQWEAARGAYCVFTQIGQENPVCGPANTPSMYLCDPWVSGSTLGGTTTGCWLGGTNVLYPPSTTVLNARLYTPYNTSGVYLTGLSNQTTLQINLKLLVETVPDPRSPLVTLAQPSPDFDLEALRLYTELALHLPPGVPVDENPDGEWFESILGTLGQLAEMGGAINPLFTIAGKGLQLASKAVPHVVNFVKGNQKSRPKQTPPKPALTNKKVIAPQGSKLFKGKKK